MFPVLARRLQSLRRAYHVPARNEELTETILGKLLDCKPSDLQVVTSQGAFFIHAFIQQARELIATHDDLSFIEGMMNHITGTEITRAEVSPSLRMQDSDLMLGKLCKQALNNLPEAEKNGKFEAFLYDFSKGFTHEPFSTQEVLRHAQRMFPFSEKQAGALLEAAEDDHLEQLEKKYRCTP